MTSVESGRVKNINIKKQELLSTFHETKQEEENPKGRRAFYINKMDREM